MNSRLSFFLTAVLLLLAGAASYASGPGSSFMTNVYGRDFRLLNGKWNVIVDLYDQGEKMEIYRRRVL